MNWLQKHGILIVLRIGVYNVNTIYKKMILFFIYIYQNKLNIGIMKNA